MAVTFSDLHTESGLKSLDEFLSGKTYISGNQLTKDDIKVFAAALEKPTAFPNASRCFPDKAVGVEVGAQAAAAEAAPIKETKEVDELESNLKI